MMTQLLERLRAKRRSLFRFPVRSIFSYPNPLSSLVLALSFD